jgi:hypothetical protein
MLTINKPQPKPVVKAPVKTAATKKPVVKAPPPAEPDESEDEPVQNPVAKKVTKNVVAKVSQAHPDGSESEQVEEVGSVVVPEPHCMVEISVGLTRNLGNYESLKFNVGISIPCSLNEEDINETFDQGKAWVDEKVNAINSEVDAIVGQASEG